MRDDKTRAYVKADLMGAGVMIGAVTEDHYITWEARRERVTDEGTELPANAWLHLRDDVARAVYAALAEFYGHGANDVRTLRRDYDAERARVDRLIGNLIDRPNV